MSQTSNSIQYFGQAKVEQKMQTQQVQAQIQQQAQEMLRQMKLPQMQALEDQKQMMALEDESESEPMSEEVQIGGRLGMVEKTILIFQWNTFIHAQVICDDTFKLKRSLSDSHLLSQRP
jgi:hypothetical protein